MLKGFGGKFVLIFALMIGIITAPTYYIYDHLIEQYWITERTKVQAVVDASVKIIDDFYMQAHSGKITKEEAQERAKDAIRAIRYNTTDYVWINDLNPTMIMHPIMPELDNTDVSDYQDPNGKYLFRDFIVATRESGEGYVEYLWPRPGEQKPVEKVSFVKLHEPWGWIVGSGIYKKDIADIIIRKDGTPMMLTVIVLVMALIILFIYIKKMFTDVLIDTTNFLRHILRGQPDDGLMNKYKNNKNIVGLLCRTAFEYRDKIDELERLKRNKLNLLDNIEDELFTIKSTISEYIFEDGNEINMLNAMIDARNGKPEKYISGVVDEIKDVTSLSQHDTVELLRILSGLRGYLDDLKTISNSWNENNDKFLSLLEHFDVEIPHREKVDNKTLVNMNKGVEKLISKVREERELLNGRTALHDIERL